MADERTVHDQDDFDESKRILEGLKECEYQERVARAREEYERGGRITCH